MTIFALSAENYTTCQAQTRYGGEYLYRRGFDRYSVRNTCPNCYTVQDFCRDHPYGTYILKTHGHVVAVVNGDYYDTFDSGSDTVIYYWAK